MTTEGSILRAVRAAVAERSPLAGGTVEAVTVGDRLVMVEVTGDGDRTTAGVAHRPPGDPPTDPSGEPALATASWATESTDVGALPRRAVGVAALNALSATLVDWRTGDPFEALADAVEVIATVGLFGPAFRKFGAVEVRVVEREAVSPPETPEGVTVSVFEPAAADRAFAGADVVFVTGSTLLYGGAESYLDAARDVPDVVLVGATASFLPEPAFEAGATMLAGARVTDAAALRGRIAAGECATDLHDGGLEKVYVAADGPGERLELD